MLGYTNFSCSFLQHFWILVRGFSGIRFLKYCKKLCVCQEIELIINKLVEITINPDLNKRYALCTSKQHQIFLMTLLTYTRTEGFVICQFGVEL